MNSKTLNVSFQKIFILAGELSGDKNGAWYLQKLLKEKPENITCEAVGGDSLKAVGAKLYERIESLNLTGIFEILKHLPKVFKFMDKVVEYILKNDFDEIILVDYPGFNLRVAKKLKKLKPDINITYLAPPQTWAWGKGRIKTIKECCNKVIVLYPFEVDWYKKHGLNVEFVGNPTYDKIKKEIVNVVVKENIVLILPGSRDHEIDFLFPLFIDVARQMRRRWKDIRFVIPLAESINSELLEKKLRQLRFSGVEIIKDEKEKFKVTSKACLAISKPGTITLELGLMGVPTVVAFKVLWATYLLGRLLTNIKYMSLPNLLLNKELFKELIQGDCNSKTIFNYASNLYEQFISGKSTNLKNKKDFKSLVELFENK